MLLWFSRDVRLYPTMRQHAMGQDETARLVPARPGRPRLPSAPRAVSLRSRTRSCGVASVGFRHPCYVCSAFLFISTYLKVPLYISISRVHYISLQQFCNCICYFHHYLPVFRRVCVLCDCGNGWSLALGSVIAAMIRLRQWHKSCASLAQNIFLVYSCY